MSIQTITTVLTAADSYALTTLDVIRDELGVTDNSKNAKLQRWLTSASAAIAQYCNRVFPVETIQDEFWAQRDPAPVLIVGNIPVLQLSRWPVISVTSVVENGVTLVEGTDFRVDKTNGQLIRLDLNVMPRRWPAWPIAVIYQAGFATIPSDVEEAVIRMVKTRYNARSDSALKQENIPGVIERSWWIATGSESGNMSPDITDILDNYRVPVVTA